MLSWNVRKNLRFQGYEQLTSMLHNRNHGFLTERILKSEVVSKFLRQLSNWEFLPWESGEFYRVTWMLVAHELKKNRCVHSLKYDWKYDWNWNMIEKPPYQLFTLAQNSLLKPDFRFVWLTITPFPELLGCFSKNC